MVSGGATGDLAAVAGPFAAGEAVLLALSLAITGGATEGAGRRGAAVSLGFAAAVVDMLGAVAVEVIGAVDDVDEAGATAEAAPAGGVAGDEGFVPEQPAIRMAQKNPTTGATRIGCPKHRDSGPTV